MYKINSGVCKRGLPAPPGTLRNQHFLTKFLMLFDISLGIIANSVEERDKTGVFFKMAALFKCKKILPAIFRGILYSMPLSTKLKLWLRCVICICIYMKILPQTYT